MTLSSVSAFGFSLSFNGNSQGSKPEEDIKHSPAAHTHLDI